MSIGWGQDCDENMFWTDCGLPFDCNPTCSNPNPEQFSLCPTVCEIGCFCNEGYIFSDDSYSECILLEDCEECSETNGDNNNDNIIDILDIVSTVNCILFDDCSGCSDFNEDGLTDILDIVGLVNVILDN